MTRVDPSVDEQIERDRAREAEIDGMLPDERGILYADRVRTTMYVDLVDAIRYRDGIHGTQRLALCLRRARQHGMLTQAMIRSARDQGMRLSERDARLRLEEELRRG